MAYKKVYPSDFKSQLRFDPRDARLHAVADPESKYNADLWSIKYLFDQGLGDRPTEVQISGQISNRMALRMYYLRYLFPFIKFHDKQGDRYIEVAEEIIKNIGKKYITYEASCCPFDDRGTKEKKESKVEEDMASNLSKYIPDFSPGVKVLRQFPANIFQYPISNESRTTDKLWIDMVSVNDMQELSPIELKVGGNIPLDLFAQGLDYGIYCYLFKQHIKENWFGLRSSSPQEKVTIYYVGEKFHPALVGRGSEKGIVSLIRENDLFNIVFIQIALDDHGQHVASSEIFPDARRP